MAGYPGYPSGPTSNGYPYPTPPSHNFGQYGAPPGGYEPPPPYYGGSPSPQYPSPPTNAPTQKSSGSGIMNFAKKHGEEIAGAAMAYKMGGKLGKVMATGMAYDLAHKFQAEQKHSSASSTSHPSYNGGTSYPASGGTYNYPSSSASGSSVKPSSSTSSLATDLLKAGGALLSKGQKAASEFAGGFKDEWGASKFLKSGNVVQIVSRATGRPLQIMQSTAGPLVLDALGSESLQAMNAHFTVICGDDKTVLLHNNHNYIAVHGGCLVVYMIGPNTYPPPNCRFVVHEPESKWYSFESVAENGMAIAVYPNGEPKPHTNFKDPNALFGLRLVYSPHQ